MRNETIKTYQHEGSKEEKGEREGRDKAPTLGIVISGTIIKLKKRLIKRRIIEKKRDE